MTLFDVGRLCLKLAGRDAGKKCVVVDVIDNAYVVVDGETRRKKVNVKHLEPLEETIDLNAGASHEVVKSAFKKLGLEVSDKKPRNAAPKPLKQKAKKEVSGKKAKTEAKKEEKSEAKVSAEKPKKTAAKKQ
jgi:large subunit ribosomal protein L14e